MVLERKKAVKLGLIYRCNSNKLSSIAEISFLKHKKSLRKKSRGKILNEPQTKYTCQICGTDKGGSFCTICNTDTPSNIALELSDEVGTNDYLQGTLKGPLGKRVYTKNTYRRQASGDKNLPDGVEITRLIDHENDWC